VKLKQSINMISIVEPKYKVGDSVFFAFGETPISTRITKVILTHFYTESKDIQSDTTIKYHITFTGLNEQREENIFQT